MSDRKQTEMLKTGKSLEQLAARLEKVLSPSDSITIETRKRIRDKRTGRLREHDIVLTIHEAHHSIIIALECRDRSRPIGVGEVEAFSRKCEDTGINQGVMVSAIGFHETAKRKAASFGIRCLTLKEALSFNWLQATSMKTLLVNPVHTHINYIFQSEEIPKDLEDYSLVDSNGVEVPGNFISGNALEQLQILHSQSDSIDSGEETFTFDGQGFSLRDNRIGALYPLRYMVVKVQYEVKKSLAFFTLYQYSDESAGNIISDAAMTKIDFGDFMADMAFIKESKEGMKLVFFAPPGMTITAKEPEDKKGD